MLIILLTLTCSFFVNHSKNFIDFELDSILPVRNQNENILKTYRKKFHDQIIMIISKYNKKDQNQNISPKTLFDLKNRLMKTNLLELSSSTDYQKLPEFYFNHRYNFSIPLELNCPECEETEIKNKISAYVQDAIFNPFASITAQELKYDPYLATRTILNNLSSQFRYKFDDEFMYIETGDMERHYIFNLKLKKSITSDEQEKLNRLFQTLKQELESKNIKLDYSGEIFYAYSAQKSSVADLTKITFFSLTVLIALYIFTFKSLKPLIFTLLPLSISFTYGFLSVVVFYGSIHILSLTLGAALIGICVDYYIHTLMFISQQKGRKNFNLTELLKPLFMSLITSITAYVVMSFSNLVVLKELSLLAIISLISTYIIIYIFLNYCDYLKLKQINTPHVIYLLIDLYKKVPYKLFVSLSFLVFISGSYGLYIIQPDDDVASMQNKDEALLAMNESINSMITNTADVSWYVIHNNALEDSLKTCEKYLFSSNSTNSFLPCSLIPSIEKQGRVFSFYKKWYPTLKEVYRKNKFNLKDANVSLDKINIITEDSSPVDLNFFISNSTLLLKVDNKDLNLINSLNQDPSIIKLDNRATWSNTLKKFRKELDLVFIIALSISIIALIPYFRKKIISNYSLPMMIGIFCAICAEYILGSAYFNLFTTLAFFMILGLGADYCIFLREQDTKTMAIKVHTLFITLLTTEASFGILGTSETPVIASYGTVLTFGLLGVFFTNLFFSLRTSEGHNKK